MDIPPFCPNSRCINHLTPIAKVWQRKTGFHSTVNFGRIQRYRCLSCGKTFSERTFSIDFYSKRAFDYRDLASRHNEGMSQRGISRAMGSSCGSVQLRIDKLARQAVAMHEALRPDAAHFEDICIDGLVSFDVSQYFPSEITIAISRETHFFIDISHATRRRSGTMTSQQKARSAMLYSRFTFERNAISRTFQDVLGTFETERAPQRTTPLVIITDEKKEYSRTIHRWNAWKTQDEDRRVAHVRINSKLARTRRNPLFSSNYLDREIRKDQANHHRESTCFNRNVANGMSRLALYLVCHNYLKKFNIKARISDDRSHAEVAGVKRNDIDKAVLRMFTKRAFLSRTSLAPTLRKIWEKEFNTPLQEKRNRLPAYAFA